MRRLSFAALSCCAVLAAQAAAAAPVTEYALRNGLKVIVKEDHRAPVVVSQIWYKIGSSYEHDGITGVSHVLEHMMFKGTSKHPAGEFSRIISANGGRENAFTGRDYTAYFQQLEKSRLPVSFELEADRMRHLLLPEEEFAKELQVVIEERRLRTEDDPEALTSEQFNAAAFTASPYRHPIIGWLDDLNNLRIADLRRWYEHWYAPNNATLVVVGDVAPEEVRRLAEKYFGRLKPAALQSPKPRREPAQLGMRRIVVRAAAELPYVLLGYKVPVLGTAAEPWEPYALDMLSAVLDGGASARLPRNIVRGAQVAVRAGAGYNMTARTDDLLLLDGTPAPDHDAAALEAALREEIRQLRETAVTAEELARVKAQVVARAVYERDSMFYQAMQIGILETAGLDWRLVDEYVERIRAVTAEQVQTVARRYLRDERLTVAVLEPLPIDGGAAPRPAAPGGHH